jgi:putative inorganic carbon (hco3(-)) transporter
LPTPAEQRFGSGRSGNQYRFNLPEGIILFLAVPFLLFPQAFLPITLTVLILLAVIWLLPLFIRPRQPNIPPTPFNIVLIFWCLALSTGILVTADPAETLPKATGLILGLAVWRYMAIVVSTRRLVMIATVATILVAIGFSFIGMAALDDIVKIPVLVSLNPARDLSTPVLEGLAIHPNQLAGLLSLYLPLLLSLLFGGWMHGWSRGWRIVLVISTLFALAMLVLTQSRGGWIGFIAGIGALVALWSVMLPPSRGRTLLRGSFLVIGLLIVVGTLMIGPSTIESFWLNPPAETVVGTLETLNFRRELWPWAITAISDFPFTGTGLGAFRHVAFRIYPLSINPSYDIGHAHNIFLQTTLDVGIPGLIIYLALLLLAAGVGWQVARRKPTFRPVALGVLAGLVAFHVYGQADAIALGAKPGLILWMFFGLLTAMNQVIDPITYRTDNVIDH